MKLCDKDSYGTMNIYYNYKNVKGKKAHSLKTER